jgi:hypothetical protein
MAKKNDRPRDMANDLITLMYRGTKRWTRTVKAEERKPASRSFRAQRMTRGRGVSFKDAAAEIMEKAYNKVSGNGLYPANARQIMYAARPHIQEKTGRQLDDNGFGIGTLKVRHYLAGFHSPTLIDAAFSQAKVETSGPSGSFGAVLFLEKEGFDQILEAAHIADRYDVALMSTKGMSVTAARALADQMCSDHDIPLLLLHDFDKAGFSIAGTLQRDTRRYEFRNSIATIDLGLGLDDVEEMGWKANTSIIRKGPSAQ